ncbi:TPA: hypothetical protein DDW35_03195 [Candidatus Sumerlaeota bacterium]|nr:hypothetical protein [Candidatus Sumerlaeota bacterium]
MTAPFGSSYSLANEAGSQTVLVVARSPQSRIVWIQQAHHAGHATREASSLQGAVEALRSSVPDLVVCGSDLPNGGARELCRYIKDDGQLGHTYVVLLADSDQGDTAWGRLERDTEDEAALVLPASLSARELVAHLRAGLRIAALRRHAQELRHHIQTELDSVWDLQKKFLPQTFRIPDTLDFTAFYLPCTESGGDYYDLIPLKNDGRLVIVIADVCGHGAPAMVAMALLRQNVHQNAQRFAQPGELLEELNRLLYDHLPTHQYATMHCAFLNLSTLECAYASAGHPAPFWFRPGRGVQALEGCAGFPLKLVRRDASYDTHVIQLQPGDKMVYYTDGIPELFSEDEIPYGEERLAKIIEDHGATDSVGQLESRITSDLMEYAGRPNADDDITLAILAVKAAVKP